MLKRQNGQIYYSDFFIFFEVRQVKKQMLRFLKSLQTPGMTIDEYKSVLKTALNIS